MKIKNNMNIAFSIYTWERWKLLHLLFALPACVFYFYLCGWKEIRADKVISVAGGKRSKWRAEWVVACQSCQVREGKRVCFLVFIPRDTFAATLPLSRVLLNIFAIFAYIIRRSVLSLSPFPSIYPFLHFPSPAFLPWLSTLLQQEIKNKPLISCLLYKLTRKTW